MKNYPESETIYRELKKSKKIALSLHIGPDADSVGSNLAFAQALESIGISADIFSSDAPPEFLSFLPNFKKIQNKDIAEANLESYDLLVTLDSADKLRITRSNKNLDFPTEKTIVIDHHASNPGYGSVNLIDSKASSTAEILYALFTKWDVDVTRDMATCLLAGIAGDTGTFRYSSTTWETLKVASTLIETGASLPDIVFNTYQRVPFESFKYLGLLAENSEIKAVGKYKFLWATATENQITRIGGLHFTHGASDFLANIEGTDFGAVIKEEGKGVISGSFRTRTGVDVKELASLFGGGGHRAAAGFRYQSKESFEKETQRMLTLIEEALSK